MAADRCDLSTKNGIRVSGIDIEWNPVRGTCTFERLPVAMMWVDSTLAGLMSGVQAMVGTERFVLALQGEGRKSVEADWRVISGFADFREGFKAIANIAAVAGWGEWILASLDEERRECRFIVRESWEGRYQKALGVCWGSGMVAGKLAGYCSRLFGANCWADQTAFIARGDESDEFVVRPSPRSIEGEIENLLASDEATRADMAVALRKLEQEIAERTRTEAALRESERKYRLIAENTADTIWTMDLDLRFRYVSPSVLKLRGFTVEEALSQTMEQVLTPPSLAVAMRILEAEMVQLAAGTADPTRTVNIELEEYRKDGSTVWVENTVSFLRDEEGKPAGILGISRDISERREAESEMRKLAAAVKHSSELVNLATLDGRMIFLNDAGGRMLGIDPQNVGRHFILDVIPDHMMGIVKEDLLPALMRGDTWEGDLQYRNLATGALTDVHAVTFTISDPLTGASLYLANVSNDVTERKRAEAAIRESEERYRNFVANASEGIFRLDLVPPVRIDQPYEVLVAEIARNAVVGEVNAALSGMYGLRPEQMIGRPVAEFAPDCGVQMADLLMTKDFRIMDREEQEVKADGSPIFIVESYDGVVEDGVLKRVWGVQRDITERKLAEGERLDLERRLLHAQKLESMGILAGGIAHDFNNLLMGIVGNLDLALQDLSPTSAARSGIERAIEATRRATDLTRQMLAYSGRGHFIISRMNLGELVRENVELFRTAIARTVSLNLVPPAAEPVIEADPGQVQQVIMNLITNASEAIGTDPGVITLSTGVTECDEGCLARSRVERRPDPGFFAFVEVSDTGCGMDDEVQQRLFDPFFTTKFTGRGLGMAAVLGIVRGHGGAIFVDSAPGKGTTIRVLFPAAEASAETPASAPETPAPVGDAPAAGRMLLVVDDEEIVRRIGLSFARHLGLQGISASNGEEALALFRRHVNEVACVLLDLTMPRMDGVSVFREMKRIRPDIPVILSSGYNEQDAIQRFTGEGLAGFIQKPYRLQEFADKIARALNRKS